MKSQQTVFTLILVTGLVTGCNSQPDTPAETPSVQTTPLAHPATKPTMPTLEPIADAPKLTEESLRAIEKRYSCALPTDYRAFLLSNNGAFPLPDCVNFQEAGRKTAADVFCFFSIGDDRAWASMDWHHETFEGRLPKNTLPIGRDSGGNLWLLSVRNEDAGSIFFWDHGSYDTFDETDLENWPKVASSFSEFRDNLRTYDASTETGGVPSRYSLVKQASDGMVKRDAKFSTRAHPGFVWHCDCDDDGTVRMQFVQYQVHAAVPHTCGYTRLRAIKGLIKADQPRLPQ